MDKPISNLNAFNMDTFKILTMKHFIDAHAHIDRFLNPDGIVEETKRLGGIAIVSSGYDHEANQTTMLVARRYRGFVFPAIGLAPTVVMDLDDAEFERQFEFIKGTINDCVAMGEIGLDFYWPTKQEQIDNQYKFFKRQLDFALDSNIPVVIHSRKAEKEAIEFLKERGAEKVLLHYFSGSPELANIAADEGYFFTVPPVKSRTRRKLVEEMPIEHIMIESDSPYVSNHPSSVLYAAQFIADAKGISIEEVLKSTTENAKRFFGLRL